METVKVTIKSFKDNKNEVMCMAVDASTKDCYNAFASVLGFDEFGNTSFEVRGNAIKGDLDKTNHVVTWVENRYGKFVTLYADDQDALDKFEERILGSTHYNCVYFDNNTKLNPRNFAKIGK